MPSTQPITFAIIINIEMPYGSVTRNGAKTKEAISPETKINAITRNVVDAVLVGIMRDFYFC